MKTRKNTKLAIFTLIILITTSFYLINVNLAQQNSERRSINLNYTDSSPLQILNDTALASYASSGDGSAATPFIIEGLNITTSNTYAIYIQDTTSNLIIRDCLLIADEDALTFSSVSSNSTLEISNNIIRSWDSGILIISTNYVNITHNAVYGCSIGIETTNSDYVRLESNSCYGNNLGIYTSSSDHLTLFDNKCYSNAQHGVYISTNSNFPNITYNQFYGNSQDGLIVDNSILASITHNECYLNGYYGIEVHTGSSNSIEFNDIHDNSRYGMYIWSTNTATIANNTITSNAWHGIYCRYTTNSIISDNTAVDDGFCFELSNQVDYNGLTIDGNTVNGKPLGYYNGAGEIILSGDSYGQLILVFCSGTIVKDYSISDTSIALTIVGGESVIIDNCDLSNNNYGSIRFDSTMNLTIQNTKCNNNAAYGGLYSFGAINTTIYNVTASNSDFGIYLSGAMNFNITHSTVNLNTWYNSRFQSCAAGNLEYNAFTNSADVGMLLYNCDYTNISYNLFEDNSGFAIYSTADTMGNWIHHNAFINNNPGGISQAGEESTQNVWYDPWTMEGNYWDDYSGSGNYTLAGAAKANDTYPLGEIPPGVPEFNNLTYLILIIPVVTVSSLIVRRRKR